MLFYWRTQDKKRNKWLRWIEGTFWWRPTWREYETIGFNGNSQVKRELHEGPCIHLEWKFFTNFYHIHLTFDKYDDDQIQFSLGCGLFVFWLGLGNVNWKWIPENRESEIAYHNSCLWIFPWRNSNEWCRSDPWWKRGLVFHMPWDWEHVRHEVLNSEGKLVKPAEKWEVIDGKMKDNENYIDERQYWMQPYKYTLESSEVQDRIATIFVDEREWRWRWFTWLPWPRKISRGIEVTFDQEVGERTGSWKGGCTGCSYDIKKNEHPVDCLRRMEKERKFR